MGDRAYVRVADVSPPLYITCTCGHLGSKHRDDGSCARCECAKFVHPVRVYARSSPAAIRGKPNGRRNKHVWDSA